MKNFEKYLYEIAGTICRFSSIAYRNPDEANCTCLTVDPREHNIHTVMKWLLAEYQEPIRLTHDEYVILKNIPSDYKWIARKRDSVLCVIWKGGNKPHKEESWWTGLYHEIHLFINLFQFIKWEDEEPYEIAKLIADYEKENCDG